MVLPLYSEFSLIELFKIEDPVLLGNAILKELVLLTESKSGAVYFINHINKCFDIKFSCGDELFPDICDLSDIKINELISTIEASIDKKKGVVLFPIFRTSKIQKRKYFIGFLELVGVISFNNEVIQNLQKSMFLFNEVYNKMMLSNLMSVMNQPIDFKQPKDQYFNNLLKLISRSTGFPYIAIREYDKESDSLICISHEGFEESKPPPNFMDGKIPESFLYVLVHKISNQFDFKNSLDNYEVLIEKGISRYIVLPIIVGNDIWGVLSLATSYDYYFDQNEILGLESVAHGIGISITNYRNFQEVNAVSTKNAINHAMMNGVEIMQYSRHEARNILSEANTVLLLILKTKDENKRNILINELSDQINSINYFLDKIKTATSPPDKILEEISLKDLWEEARQMLSGRADKLNIKIQSLNVKNDIKIFAYKDWLRHAFMNLLQNSADAFESKKRSNREISMSIDLNSLNTDMIKLIYSDNAGGIEVNNLAIPTTVDEKTKSDLNRLIFERSVTSKGKKGTGYGLFLTRTIIQEYHKGNINLINYRGGVTFSIEIPKKLKE